ncbi:MAG: hypothetical protein QGF94_01150 [Candidatus Thalassarchaeaceae archaeon]|nr:hypothetical protein [Candidatus Thalassarchaeaceae archaeon]
MGDDDSGFAVEIQLRWPPFDSDTVIPSALPLATERFRLTEETESPCDVMIGQDDDFHIVRKVVKCNSGLSGCRDWRTESSRVPNRIQRSRTGWFIVPNKIHRLSRKLIPFAVIGIIASLAIHAFEPALVDWGIVDGSFAGSVRLGLLDYPILLLIFLPFFFFPIAMRFGASIWDFRRTRRFRKSLPQSPTIEIMGKATTSNPVSTRIKLNHAPDDWVSAKTRIQVGLLNPRRPMLLHAFGRKEGKQNPPGISTPLSIHQYADAELGSGFGESTPLQGPDTQRLFMSPLPVLSRGEMVDLPLEGAELNLPLPDGDWPGSEYHPLFATHWEILIKIEREMDGPLIFVEHLIMEHDGGACIIEKMPVQSGRSEFANV